MNKNLTIIFLSCVIAVLLAFLLWPDKQHDMHEDHHMDVIANNDTLKAHEVISAHVIDSLSKTIAAKDSINKTLREGQASTRKQLDLKTAQVRDLTAQIREYNKDTGFFGHLLDSLQSLTENYSFLLTQYEAYSDSINTVNDSLRIAIAAKDAEKDKAKAELQAGYNKLFKAYTELFASSQAMAKDLKRQKLKTKIVALLGGAAAVLGLVR